MTNAVSIPPCYTEDFPKEIHFITSIHNVQSIIKNGIMSRKRAGRLTDNISDLSNSEVQDRRATKIPKNPIRDQADKQQLRLHRYVNLFFRAHNATMYTSKIPKEELCVLRLSIAILENPEALATNNNAASDGTAFTSAQEFKPTKWMIECLQEPYSNFQEYKWWDRKKTLLSEVLVPYQVHPSYIQGIFVPNEASKDTITKLFQGRESPIPITVYPSIFYNCSEARIPLEKIEFPGMYNKNYLTLHTELPESSDEEEDTEMEIDDQ